MKQFQAMYGTLPRLCDNRTEMLVRAPEIRGAAVCLDQIPLLRRTDAHSNVEMCRE